MILVLLLGLGSPVISQNHPELPKSEFQGEPSSARDRYFENTIFHYETADGKTKVISYKSMDQDIKSKIPPPPPMPPSPSDTEQKNKEIDPLPKGTVVFLTKDGSIHIGGKKEGVMTMPPPPPPPHEPKALNNPKDFKTPNPPNPPNPPMPPVPVKGAAPHVPPVAPVAPPPPPPPSGPSLDDLAEAGAIFYIDDKVVSSKEAITLWEDNMDDVSCIDFKKDDDGNMSVHIKKK
jgi:hypothetical protein